MTGNLYCPATVLTLQAPNIEHVTTQPLMPKYRSSSTLGSWLGKRETTVKKASLEDSGSTTMTNRPASTAWHKGHKYLAPVEKAGGTMLCISHQALLNTAHLFTKPKAVVTDTSSRGAHLLATDCTRRSTYSHQHEAKELHVCRHRECMGSARNVWPTYTTTLASEKAAIGDGLSTLASGLLLGKSSTSSWNSTRTPATTFG